ncbi:zinc knuckle CX2CX4HX4C containing protein [Tanacetum coccineum]
MRTKRNSKAPKRFEDSIHSIYNSKTNKKTAPKMNDASKKNSEVCENDTEKDLESNGSEGSGKDGCIGPTDVRKRSDDLREDMINNNAGMDVIENEENAQNLMGKIQYLKTYATIMKDDELPKNLNYIPTLIAEPGNEVVIFEEAFVSKGSERWNLTLCGQFVGHVINIYELRYNIRRMWSKFGISDINIHKNGHSEMGMEKLEPKCLLVWVKIINVPLKAWSIDGISAIASSLGMHIMMDNSTATMCYKGIRSFEFARVLVEMVAEKELKKEIVFGHDVKHSNKGGVVNGGRDNPKIVETSKEGKEDQNSGNFKENRKEMYQGSNSNNRINNARNQSAKTSQSYQWQTNGNRRGRLNNNKKQEYRKRQMDAENLEKWGNNSKVQHNKWNVKEKVVEEIRNTANKFSVLNSLPEDNDQELRTNLKTE